MHGHNKPKSAQSPLTPISYGAARECQQTRSSSGYEREPCAALKLNPACRSGLTVRRDFPHDNLFHTLMGLMQVVSSEYDPRLDLTAQCPL